ncbi:hypothetical protein [Rhizobium sp. BR 249]|uniref:hypothetical protein n=1 Tax=Rhizobium sp. BR 249 TaxID=3040011 RepID=UPI0039BF7091
MSGEYFLSGLRKPENMQSLEVARRQKENARWDTAGVSIEDDTAWEEAAIALN